ncbi:MAG TPA: response regulator transcription factor [Pelobium sp.]|nr:response regulator transcription factor [Pelobium sp.]
MILLQLMKVLIVEDETELAHSMLNYLQNQDYTCELAYDVEEAKEKLTLSDFECVILDIMLPFGSGFDLLKLLKESGNESRIIVISAKNSTDDKTRSLNIGADDYLAKPFHLAELSARVQSTIIKQGLVGSDSINYKKLSISLPLKRVNVAGIEIEITKTEFSLLLFLLLNKGKVVSKNAIAENLSSQSALYFDNFDIIHSHIKSLKKKLGIAGDYIKNVYNTGYNLS